METMTKMNAPGFEMAWQKSVPNVAWGTIALFLGISLGYILTIKAALSGELHYGVATLLLGYFCFASFTVMHDAGHGSIVKIGSKLKPLETWLGWISSVPLLIAPYRAFQRIHDRHHAFTNDPERDPDHFSFGDRWYHVLLNTFFIPVQYHWLMFTKLRHIRVIRETYLSTAIYTVMVFGGLTTLGLSGYGLEVLCFAVIPTLIAVFLLVMFFDFIPHHPQASLDPYHNTRIYPGPLMNVALLGQNYHLIHHLYPRVPWYKYQSLYRDIRPELEAKGAPIEDVLGLMNPGLLDSPNASLVKSSDRAMKRVLKVSSLERTCEGAVSISFALPKGQRLAFKAGQYLVLNKWLDGELQSRCYSICSSPEDTELKVGVRAVSGGLMSHYLNQQLQAGDELVVEGPFGDFVYEPEMQTGISHLILVAGGSGITPILSIIESALTQPRGPRVHLIYANRSPETTMFRERLQELEQNHPQRFKLDIGYSESAESAGAFELLERESLNSLISGNWGEDVFTGESHFYICGPDGLKDSVQAYLCEQSVPESRVSVERFVTSVTEPEGECHEVLVNLADGETYALQVAENQTILEVAKQASVPIPRACEAGSCGTCKCHLEKGVAALPDTASGLSDDEIQQGYTLACQARPRSDLVLSEVHF